MKKKVISLLLVSALATSMLAGCGGSTAETTTGSSEGDTTTATTAAQGMDSGSIGGEGSEGEAEKRYDHVTIALQSDWGNMQAINAHVGTRDLVLTNIYEPLFDYDPSQTGMDMYTPLLAKGFEKVEDSSWEGDIYDVTLYDYIKDTAGNEITADDVVYCYDYNWNNGYVTKSDMLEKWEKIDDYTVRFYFNKAIDSLGELEYVWCRYPIVDESEMEKGVTDPVGTGTYKVKEWVSGSYIIFEANDDYWQKDELINPLHYRNVQEIEYKLISEASSQVIELQTGKLDYSEYIPTENISEFADGGQYADSFDVFQMNRDYTVLLVPSEGENSICKDVNMRLAIYYAISNDAIETALGGVYKAAKTLGSPRFTDYYSKWEDETTYINTYDLEKSKEYLAKTSYAGEELILSYDSSRASIAEVLQNMLSQAGINVKLSPNESSSTTSVQADYNSWDLRLNGFGGTFLVSGWNKYMNADDNGTGYCVGGYRDEEFYSLYKTAKTLDGHTEENMTAVVDYVTDESHAYMDAVCYSVLSVVYSNSTFSSLYYREGCYLMPGACSYVVE